MTIIGAGLKACTTAAALVVRAFRPAVIVAIIAVAAVSLRASSPKFFQAATQTEFLRGDIQNLSVDNRGQLTLGLATELIYETAAPFLWSLAAGPDGTLFVGTGNEGRVFKIDAQGKGTPFFDAAELEAHALAAAPDGSLFVGSSPDGTIYKIDRNGTAQPFFDPDDRYIWALTLDPKGNLYAATGDHGVIYKISPDGKGTRFYQAKAMHATALAFDKAGNLLVGTESPGRVLRIAPDGKAFVLLDSPFQEIRSLRFDDKGVFAPRPWRGQAAGPRRAGDRHRSNDSPENGPRPSRPSQRSLIAIVDGPAAAAPPRRAARIAVRREEPSTASRRTVCGINSGSRAKTHPTISSSTSKGGSSSAPATKARSTGWKAIRPSPRCSPAPARNR
jgi:sugar lactone lactonase YvrE